MYTKLFRLSLIIVAFLCSSPHAFAQKMTEQFIPIGQSPGLSNEYTYIGAIESVDQDARTVTAAGGHPVDITEETHIWLDRSSLELSNQVGDFADLQRGGKVEIKYEDNENKAVADWVKVEVPTP
jgi:hypothetical protein